MRGAVRTRSLDEAEANYELIESVRKDGISGNEEEN
jgi:hypothetical protein